MDTSVWARVKERVCGKIDSISIVGYLWFGMAV